MMQKQTFSRLMVSLISALCVCIGAAQAQERSPVRPTGNSASPMESPRPSPPRPESGPGLESSTNSAPSASSPIAAPPRPAQQKPSTPSNPDFNFLFSGGYNVGGELLADSGASYADTKSIKTGQGFEFRLGFENRFRNQTAVQMTVGYHVDSSSGSNGTVSFSRVPVELLGFIGGINQQWRFGLGLRKATNANFSSTDNLSLIGGSGQAESSLGWIISAEYRFNPNFGLGLRHVRESYLFDGMTERLDGSYTGFIISGYF
jgi:hypothetical protein